MEQILNEILNGINSLRNDINTLKTEHIKTNERLTTLELSQEKLKKKLDSVIEQTDNLIEVNVSAITKENSYEIANITAMNNLSCKLGEIVSKEVRNLLSNQLQELKSDVKFLNHKVADTEKDVFGIKEHIKLIK